MSKALYCKGAFLRAGLNELMTHRHNRTQWDDQELHTLFAARLPVLAIPDDFAEQLMQSVLQEIRQMAPHSDECMLGSPTAPLTNSAASEKRG